MGKCMRYLRLLFPTALVIGGCVQGLPLQINWIGEDAKIACEQAEWQPNEASCREKIMTKVCGPNARIVDVQTTSRPPIFDEWYESYLRNQRIYKWTYTIKNCRMA